MRRAVPNHRVPQSRITTRAAARLAGLALAALIAAAALAQSDYGWTQLSLSTCGVDTFLRAHPQSDGRGVVIAVLDTGVDPAIPGLAELPGGGVKVVDVQDFTGQGDVELHRVRRSDETGRVVDYDADGVALEYTPPALPDDARPDERLWWFGTLDEKRFINSDQPDINDNDQTDDQFPMLVTALPDAGDDDAVAFVDTDLDRSFADEQPLRNYRLHFDTFTFHREKPEKQIVPLTLALNIALRQQKVVVHFDDGGHGTHVAGIAAGYRINQQPDFHGVAPGAQVISLKIGNNAIGGASTTESMKKAFQYAGRYAREHGVPVVCNMSYGVDSEIEGHSDIDEFVDEFLRKNPYLVFCTSAGNSGPGLSTVGTPAAASEALTIAALMAADTGRDVAGYTMERPVVTVFSSRGGELDKPDLATPGWSTSTVPRWVRRGDFWSGTSMASPYATGLCALLLSHAGQTGSGTPVRRQEIRRALTLTARPLPGTTPLDQGYGVPDLPAAAELLPHLQEIARDDPVLGYEIATTSPLAYQGRGRTAYWRTTFRPTEERQTFTISPLFAPAADIAGRPGFTRKFELNSTASWCRVPQQTFYLHSEAPARVFVEYDAAQLKEPGLYVGTVEAIADGLVALRLINTVIVPYRFTAEENFLRTLNGRTVNGWQPERFFVAVPPGASAMKLRLAAPEGAASKAAMDRLFDPGGRQYRDGAKRLDTEAGQRLVEWIISRVLRPGVWEVDVTSNRPDKSWPFDLTVRFFGVHAEPAEIRSWDDSPPSGKLVVTNLFERPLPASADGQIEGYRLHKQDKFKGAKDSLTYTVNLDERFDRLRLRLEMTAEEYARTTDIGVQVLGADGKAIHQAAFDWRTYEALVRTGGAKTLKVVINAGFAVLEDQRETPITVNIDQLLADPVALRVTRDGESELELIPAVPVRLEYKAAEKLKDPPEKLRPVGFIRVRERATNDEALRVPIEIE